MATYVNNLGLKEIATGDESGTWGTSTNTNLTLIGEAFGYATKAIADASTATLTIPDGTETNSEPRRMYLKITGGGQACTVTLAPNTASKVWIIENVTSYTLTFTQGSGANVDILAGETKMIATDGAGSGAVVYDVLTDLNLAGTTKTAALTNAGALSNQGTVTVGVDDTGYDVKLFGATSGKYWLWDESEDGVLQYSTLTVGVDDTGYDVKFFGATSGAYMLWDESADDLVLAGAAGLDIAGDIDVDGTSNLDIVDIDGAVDMASTLQVDGAITSSAGATITTADNLDTLTLTSTDADAGVGPNLRLYRNSGSPADNDALGWIEMEGRNDNSQDVMYADIKTYIEDASDGSEDGAMYINTMIAGTLRNTVSLLPSGVVFNDESQDVDFRVESDDNANMLFVDGGNDRVGIGTGSPSDTLEISRTSTDQTAGVVIENLQSGGYGSGIIWESKRSDDASVSEAATIHVGGTDSWNSSGSRTSQMSFATIGDGTLATRATINKYNGIAFGTDTADANTLDDYEEGTWSPTLASDAGPASYTTQVGTYTKVGRLVTVTCEVKIADVGSFSGATVNLGALPFAVKNLDNNYFIGGVQINGAGTATSAPFWRLILNTQYGRLEHNNGATTTDNNMNANVIDTGTTTRATATYFV
jgi:hypothetical protein